MRVAVVQLASGPDKPHNLRRASDAVDRASATGATLVVLPEATMCGFGPTRGTDLGAQAEALDGPFVTGLTDAAARSETYVVAGMFERAGENRVYNTVVVVARGGPVASYRKLHLYDALGWQESERVCPGDPLEPLPVVEIDGFALGVMTCYDLRFPEVGRILTDRGATMLAVPAAWVAGPHKAAQWDVLLRARAIENAAFVLGAAQPPPEYTGRSAIIDPQGLELGTTPAPGDRREALLVADVTVGRVHQVRREMPVLDHRRFETHPRPTTPAAPAR